MAIYTWPESRPTGLDRYCVLRAVDIGRYLVFLTSRSIVLSLDNKPFSSIEHLLARGIGADLLTRD